jgi:hypothetical protein
MGNDLNQDNDQNFRYFRRLKLRLIQTSLPPEKSLDAVLVSDGPSIALFREESGKVLYPPDRNDVDKLVALEIRDAVRRGGSNLENQVQDLEYVLADFTFDHSLSVLKHLRQLSSILPGKTKLIVNTYSRVWFPIVRLAELFRVKKFKSHNYLPEEDLAQLMQISGFTKVKRCQGILVPFYVPVFSNFTNRWLAPLPILRKLCFVNQSVFLSPVKEFESSFSVSIIVAARNEEGNLVELVNRIPKMADSQEVIFVEGNSNDNTWEILKSLERTYNRNFTIRVFKQTGKGKSDAVHHGIRESRNDLVMILDADLSVAPESLVDFYEAMKRPDIDFCNGTRFVYPRESESMRFLNYLGNRYFSRLLGFLIGQKMTDSLCGTKVFWRSDYEGIVKEKLRNHVPDPFGDFDFLVGASRANLRIIDIPVRYGARTYGVTNISRFRDGLRLLQYCLNLAIRIKFTRVEK